VVVVLPYHVTVHVYDGSGLMVRSFDGGYSGQAITQVLLSSETFYPEDGPLKLFQGAWSASFDGRSDLGYPLQSGPYLLQVISDAGQGSQEDRRDIVVAHRVPEVGLRAWPNPLRPGQTLTLDWSASSPLDLSVYDLAGEKVADLGTWAHGPLQWSPKSASGQPLAGGIYFLQAAVPGQRPAHAFKLAVLP
jgi:hypothetical protein